MLPCPPRSDGSRISSAAAPAVFQRDCTITLIKETFFLPDQRAIRRLLTAGQGGTKGSVIPRTPRRATCDQSPEESPRLVAGAPAPSTLLVKVLPRLVKILLVRD